MGFKAASLSSSRLGFSSRLFLLGFDRLFPDFAAERGATRHDFSKPLGTWAPGHLDASCNALRAPGCCARALEADAHGRSVVPERSQGRSRQPPGAKGAKGARAEWEMHGFLSGEFVHSALQRSASNLAELHVAAPAFEVCCMKYQNSLGQASWLP